VLDLLNKWIEDFRNEFVVVLAGYPGMLQHLAAMNPGLTSPFPHGCPVP